MTLSDVLETIRWVEHVRIPDVQGIYSIFIIELRLYLLTPYRFLFMNMQVAWGSRHQLEKWPPDEFRRPIHYWSKVEHHKGKGEGREEVENKEGEPEPSGEGQEKAQVDGQES